MAEKVDYQIRIPVSSEALWLQEGFRQMGWEKPPGHFARYLQRQAAGEIVMLVAEQAGQYVGHLIIVWEPEYPFFKKNGIPEIQDLNVVPAHRRRGVATRLMDRAEEIIRARSSVVGIGVGLHPGYNAAQRMYVLRGYVPDGCGVTYRDRYIKEGQHLIADDHLVLHLVKDLTREETAGSSPKDF